MNPGNKEKFSVFLEVAGELNTSFKTIPILYGSLGLNRVIGEFGTANDIDVLVPEALVNEEWPALVALMGRLNFALKDEDEHEFIREGKVVAFAANMDLVEMAGIRLDDLKNSREDGVEFKELTPVQYLNVYELMLRDGYRQEKRGTADKDKIALIEKYLTNKK